MLGATDLYDLAVVAKDAVVAYYLAQGVELPERRYVADGIPAWFPGCPQFTTRIVRVYSGTPGAETVGEVDCLVQFTAVVGLEVTRCVPTVNDRGDPPPADDVEASAGVVLADPALLFSAVFDAYQSGDFGDCGGLAYEQWTAKGPDGGMAGGELTVRLQIGG